MPPLARQQRDQLVALMQSLGPDAPTLCAGWETRHLAAHLVLRERRPDVAAGVVLRPLAARRARAEARAAERPWPELLTTLARRPGYLVALGLDDAMNLVEFFIHLEDVRRAQPGWEPRALPREVEAGLWQGVRGIGPRAALRRTRATVRVTAPGWGSVTRGQGGPEVGLEAPPGELLLFLTGRQAHARVSLTGPSDITDRMRTARFGI